MKEMSCGREGDLISFLYGELNAADRSGFAGHLETCEGCRSQLASLSEVRQSVVTWRNESLGAVTASVAARPALVAQSNPSALAALREFFNLSPLWMKGTVAFASILFCLMAVLALARFNQTTPVNNTVAHTPAVTSKEIDAQVERRVKEELERREAIKNQSATITAGNQVEQVSPRRLANKTKRLNRSSLVIAKTARPLSKQERQELAADLRLTEDESDLDLLLIGDRINQ